jgi:hypothetical protein
LSNIAVQGGATGTGTVTLLAPVTSTDRTLTLPDATGTVLTTATAGVPINGPAFSAYLSSAQSFTLNTFTKITFQTEEFDTNSCYDNATNYRFTPTVAGYYQVSGAFTNSATIAHVAVAVYKNGSNFKRLYNGVGGGTTSTGAGSCLLYLNGSTDYIELYGLTGATQNAFAAADGTYFSAAMIRSAV